MIVNHWHSIQIRSDLIQDPSCEQRSPLSFFFFLPPPLSYQRTNQTLKLLQIDNDVTHLQIKKKQSQDGYPIKPCGFTFPVPVPEFPSNQPIYFDFTQLPKYLAQTAQSAINTNLFSLDNTYLSIERIFRFR